MPADLEVHPGWAGSLLPGLLDALRCCFRYADGEDRATGYLYETDGQPWPPELAERGPVLLAELAAQTGVAFTICAFQAYRDGAGCGWHADTPFAAQAILSLGVTRTFGVRRPGRDPWLMPVRDGDLVFMPAGFQDEWEHSVPAEDVPGERCSLVFRTKGALMGGPAVVITAARVDTADGTPAARVELVLVGGGEQVVTVDGTAETRVHPSSQLYHVRLLSPDKFVPDVLREAATFEEACALGVKYAGKLAEHAARVDELAADLKV